MVIDIDILDDNEVMVLVLFCNFIYEGMFSCEYYIEGKCKFLVDQCRFFYGDSVKFEDFREYIEFNYSLLKMEFFCLVLFIDGFWYRVVIVDILERDYQFIVSYDNYDEIVILDMKDILFFYSIDFGLSDEEDEDGEENWKINFGDDDDLNNDFLEEEMMFRYFMRLI